MFLRRQKAPAESLKARYTGGPRAASVETARVLAVSKDPAGIPHVRFSVHYERVESAENATLALSSFSELFSERVLA